MDYFHIIEDAQCILRSKGVYRQCKLFRRGEELYAGWGNGFVKIMRGGGTSHPLVSVEDLNLQGAGWFVEPGRVGAMRVGKLKVVELEKESA